MEEYYFQFVIGKLTEVKAEELFNIILTWVEDNELDLGGGYTTWKQWEEAHGNKIG